MVLLLALLVVLPLTPVNSNWQIGESSMVCVQAVEVSWKKKRLNTRGWGVRSERKRLAKYQNCEETKERKNERIKERKKK